MDLNISTILGMTANPLGAGSKLNVHKTFRRRPGRLLNVLCTLNYVLCPGEMSNYQANTFYNDI